MVSPGAEMRIFHSMGKISKSKILRKTGRGTAALDFGSMPLLGFR
jgi:hypothetical protein